MADVGRVAQVSAQTVSRYFTGAGYVSTEARARIEAAVAELGYQPNHAARSLRVNRSDTIGVLAVGALNFGSAGILAGLTAAARRQRYPLVIAHVDVDSTLAAAAVDVRRALRFFMSSRVDGIVVTTPYLGTEDLLDGLWETIPVVTLSGQPRSTADSASIDSHAAGLLATRHLVQLGHRRVLHLAGPTDIEGSRRERGYRDALGEADLPALPVVRGNWTAASGYAAGTAVALDSFTAVASANDEMALGFLSAMRERGRTAPDDFSIVGVDDMPDARYFSPPLTTMSMDFAALGGVGFTMLHERIHTGTRRETVTLTPALVVRSSTAPPPGTT